MEVAREIYRLTRQFPREEMFGLTSQMRRAAVSIPSNIAEGHARTGTREFLHGLSVALGSLAELQTQMELAAELGYVAAAARGEMIARMETLAKMLNALIRSLRSRTP
jgi:four helix bundle protein